MYPQGYMYPRLGTPELDSGSQSFSDRVPFVCPVLSSRTPLFQEKSMCQISFDQKSGKPELTQMQREQNGC